VVAAKQGDYTQAVARYEEGLTYFREAADPKGIIIALNNLGEMAIEQGAYARAGAVFAESLTRSRALGSRAFIANAIEGLGDLAWLDGDHAAAVAHYLEGLALVRELDHTWGVASQLCRLGWAAAAAGDAPQAAAHFAEGLPLGAELASKVLLAGYLAGAAAIAQIQQQPERAARLLGAAAGLLTPQGARLPAVLRHAAEQVEAATRTRLRDEAFQAAWRGGHTLPREPALALAREVLTPLLPSPTASLSPAAPTVASGTPDPAQPPLTKREGEVLRLVAAGLTTPQVAARLYLSERTVENHLRAIYGKLNVSTRAAATRIAVEQGLLQE
jgi:non-specific serine/threonine protein kinase